MALKQENREKLKMKKEKDNALQKIRDQNKENEAFSMRLDSIIDELFQVKLLSGSKDKEIISLKEEIKNLQMTLEQENPEKLKVNEGNAKDQESSNVINNQEKEIKRLKVSLDQEKEEKEEALLKNKEQNEGFWKETTYLKRQVKCLEMANQAKLKILQEKDTRDTALSMSKEREAKKGKEVLKAKDQEISKISTELGSKSLELECRNIQIKYLESSLAESCLEKNALSKAKDKNEQEKNQLVNETEHLKDQLVNAHYEIDAQYVDVNELERLKGELGQAYCEINSQYVNINEVQHLKHELERLLSDLDNSVSKALSEAKDKHELEVLKLVNEIECLKDECASKSSCLFTSLDEASVKNVEVASLRKEVKRLDDSLSKAMNQEKRNVQEIVKHVIEIEHLKAELAREMHKSRSAGILHEKKGKMLNLDDIKVKVDEFNCMKDMIRNNLEVNCLNVTFEVNNSS